MLMIQGEMGLVKPQWICQIYEQPFCSVSPHVAFTQFFKGKNKNIFGLLLYVIVILGICSVTIEIFICFGDS